MSTPSAVKQVVVATVKEKPPTPSRVSVEEEIEPFKTPPRHRNRQKGTSSRVVTPGDEGVGYVKPTAPQDVSFGYAAPGEPPVIEVVLSTERPRTTGRGSGQRARGGPVSGSEALYVPPGRRNQRAPSEGDDM